MKYSQGFMALTSVLALSAVFLALSINMASQAVSGSKANSASYASDKAQILAESCVEYALTELQRSVSYSGSESIQIGDDSCDILSVGGTGNSDRLIQTQSTVLGYTYRLEVLVALIDPAVVITSFEPVINF
jgi:hypothetical protein